MAIYHLDHGKRVTCDQCRGNLFTRREVYSYLAELPGEYHGELVRIELVCLECNVVVLTIPPRHKETTTK